MWMRFISEGELSSFDSLYAGFVQHQEFAKPRTIYPHGRDLLAVEVDHHPGVARKLLGIPGVTLQSGRGPRKDVPWNEPSPKWVTAWRCDHRTVGRVPVDGQRLRPKPPKPSPGRTPNPE
jgi:hypothetical protein